MEIAALIVSIVAATVTIVVSVFTWRRDRNKNTVTAYQELQEFLLFLHRYQPDEIETFVTDFNSDEYKTIGACLARIEIFATGVKTKLYNFKLVYSMAHGYLDGALRDKLEYLLSIKNSNRKGKFYKNTIELLGRMDQQSKKEGEN